MVHNPISITNDEELAALAISGSGTVNDPYIISGWKITDSDTYGIYIIGTTMHFRIENCLIANSSKYGIFIDNVTSGTTTVANNICNDNIVIGIYIRYSTSSTITNNTCNNNYNFGIYLQDSSSSIIVNNTCYNDGTGIYLFRSDYSRVANNIYNDNIEYGIYLGESG
ncbi:MAG: right-handed parallel beta-helix repeat-containing protein, partial [Promethearchaeota archaeon]